MTAENGGLDPRPVVVAGGDRRLRPPPGNLPLMSYLENRQLPIN